MRVCERFPPTDSDVRTNIRKTGITGGRAKKPSADQAGGQEWPSESQAKFSEIETVFVSRDYRAVLTSCRHRPACCFFKLRPRLGVRRNECGCANFGMRSGRIELYVIVNVQEIGRGVVPLPPSRMRSRAPVHL